jgi:uncharacterized protein YecE (DUF72 family)
VLPDVKTGFGFFNNHFLGHAPKNGYQMKRLLGLDAVTPDFDQQIDLF